MPYDPDPEYAKLSDCHVYHLQLCFTGVLNCKILGSIAVYIICKAFDMRTKYHTRRVYIKYSDNIVMCTALLCSLQRFVFVH